MNSTLLNCGDKVSALILLFIVCQKYKLTFTKIDAQLRSVWQGSLGVRLCSCLPRQVCQAMRLSWYSLVTKVDGWQKNWLLVPACFLLLVIGEHEARLVEKCFARICFYVLR
jgi:hypothetical protein